MSYTHNALLDPYLRIELIRTINIPNNETGREVQGTQAGTLGAFNTGRDKAGMLGAFNTGRDKGHRQGR